MPIGQNLLALFNADFSRDALPAFASGKAVSTDPDAVAAFSAILAEQTPADLDALMAQLSAAVDAETAAADPTTDLAASGKELPTDMAAWLNQLAQLLQPQTADAAAQASAEADGSTTDQQADDASVLADLSTQWQRWLSQLPADTPAAETAQPAVAGVIPSISAQPETRAVASASTVVDADDAAGTRGAVGLSELVSQLRAALRGAEGAPADTAQGGMPASAQASRPQGSEAAAPADAAQRQAALQDTTQVQQRLQASAPQPVDEAGLARLVDQLETRLGAGNGRSDADATDLSKTSAVAQLQQQGQSALSARPVTAPLQSLGVPMGQPGWSEAVVNKVMWMSSQNLQSVEIQLDPAELGPLEIKIQTRGQEHQVQFVSQNAGVRDALEGQMFRLREMFTQQGVGQLDVNVSDGSSGQRQQDGGLFAQGDGRGGERGSAGTGMLGDASDTVAPASEVSAQALLAHSRLVDYYA
ncbi:flagellar hook-length control protein FliK [Halopseudomonas pachastrellae]|nr:flagellar hook-length control protein FliK [Pseudomonadota bacterium]WVM93933.1 flagellar hook-length control protein FliK [Halopseudomonas pachastrellae]